MTERKPSTIISISDGGLTRVRQQDGTPLDGVLGVEFRQDTKEIENGDGTWRHEPVGPRYCLVMFDCSQIRVEATP